MTYATIARGLIFLIFITTLNACGGGKKHQNTNSTPAGVVGTGPGVLSVSPLDINTLVSVTPLGKLSPPGHVLPTDHVYLSFVDNNESYLTQNCTPRTVYAAGGGAVTFILQTESGGDTKIMVQMTKTFYYYYDHVLVASNIKVGSIVKAGDIIGTTTGRCPSMDLGVYDLDVNLPGFINPLRYGELGAHPASPFLYFSEPLKTTYYSKVRVFEGVPTDKDGKLDWGIKGHLIGDWFHSSLSPSAYSANPDGWAKTIAFAYDWYDHSAKISIGGTIATPMILTIAASDPDPALITPASGVIAYRDTPTGPQNRLGWILVQMLAEDRIKIEYFAQDTFPTDFTNAAQEYIR